MNYYDIKKFFAAATMIACTFSFGCDTDSAYSDSISAEDACAQDEKPKDSCKCEDGEWICPQTECDTATKPDDSCHCQNSEWVCKSDEEGCPEDCPNACHKDCSEGNNCTMVCDDPSENCDKEGSCNPQCPDDCPNGCDEKGTCKPSESPKCSQDCPEGCNELGECIISCPESCPNDCTDGVCNQVTPQCPEECPNDCDEHFECKTKCPEECPNNCDEHGVCPITCKSTCTTSCDEKGVCQCPSTCKSSCDENGVCQCPNTCTTSCDKNGVCQCPSTCKTSCDKNGVCQCPSACPGKCDSNGICPAMCGDEIIESFKFGSKELDILVPGFKTRTSSYSTLSIKTNKSTYDLSNAPCKDKITLKSTDTNVIKVEKNVGCKFTSVGAGTAQCIATLNGTDLTDSLEVHVLNPNKLQSNTAEKKDGKFKHIYRTPLKLHIGTRVAQGFDFYNDDYIYFSQLKYGVTLTDGTKLDRNGAVIFKNTQPDKNSKPMILYGSGHAQNLSIERTGNKDYVWVGNYGTLVKDAYGEGYKQSQTISRIEHQDGKTFYPNEVTDQYYFSDKKNSSYYYSFEPAIDQKNNKFAFRAYYEHDKMTHVKIFNFSKVKSLTPKAITLPRPIITVKTDSAGKSTIVTNKTTKITAKDLSDLQPTHEFKVSSLPVQGLEIENGIIYTLTGLPESSVSGQYLYKSKITLKLYTYTGTEIGTYYLRTSSENGNYLVNKDLDAAVAQTIDNVKYYNVGYFEPEGIRVSKGKVYISITTHQGYKDTSGKTTENRRQMVFVYDLTEK